MWSLPSIAREGKVFLSRGSASLPLSEHAPERTDQRKALCLLKERGSCFFHSCYHTQQYLSVESNPLQIVGYVYHILCFAFLSYSKYLTGAQHCNHVHTKTEIPPGWNRTIECILVLFSLRGKINCTRRLQRREGSHYYVACRAMHNDSLVQRSSNTYLLNQNYKMVTIGRLLLGNVAFIV